MIIVETGASTSAKLTQLPLQLHWTFDTTLVEGMRMIMVKMAISCSPPQSMTILIYMGGPWICWLVG